MHILVIDDDELIRTTLKTTLEKVGYEVTLAAEGRSGLKAFAAKPADLVITDIIMPDTEGIETITQLRRQYPDLPIIAVSGGGRTGRKEFLEVAQKLGASRVIAKPFSRDKLLDEVRGLLDRTED